MAKKLKPRDPDSSLSRNRIVDAAVELLDANGEAGLTFRALAERLSTGSGAIYWYVANKSELLTAACDAVIARSLKACAARKEPTAMIRALALALFDGIDCHPWVGAALTQAPGQAPMLRILEGLGQPMHALGVPPARQWSTVFALASYVLGVAGQNAANSQLARQSQVTDRATLLDELATQWSRLEETEYPFVRGVAERFRTHDDRADFLHGVDLLLSGITSTYGQPVGSKRSDRPKLRGDERIE